MPVNLLTKHHLEFLSLKGGYTSSSESTLVKMPHCWKSRVAAQISSTDNHSCKCIGVPSVALEMFLHPNNGDIFIHENICCGV